MEDRRTRDGAMKGRTWRGGSAGVWKRGAQIKGMINWSAGDDHQAEGRDVRTLTVTYVASYLRRFSIEDERDAAAGMAIAEPTATSRYTCASQSNNILSLPASLPVGLPLSSSSAAAESLLSSSPSPSSQLLSSSSLSLSSSSSLPSSSSL